MIKRQCALLAKGRLFPVRLKAFFEGGKESLYYELSKKENELAIKLAESAVSSTNEKQKLKVKSLATKY